MAVGEVGLLMTSAKHVRLDKLYELVADLEIFKLQLVFWFNRCCKRCFISPHHYERTDLTKKWRWWSHVKKELLESCAREVDDDGKLSEESEDEAKPDNYSSMLQSIQTTLTGMSKQPVPVSTRKIGPQKSTTGTQSKKGSKK